MRRGACSILATHQVWVVSMSRLPHVETEGHWGIGHPGKAGPRLSVQQALICFFSNPSDEAPGVTPLSRVGDAGGKSLDKLALGRPDPCL